ncbi:hypothetical protein JTE90_023445 [Oedothorax gibbosus]|uniref:Uncharacterized protein n=1 Tax=Oedothorax gibbosus TaxID=931172 RepID=A0AAV6TZL8_9ARAC|nr:hypothetical protein JTE90_023445 [Oedothorax gibbosus]
MPKWRALTVENLLNTVQKIILDDGRKNPFKNGRPGKKKWYASFLRRNPGLEPRFSQGVSKGRAIVLPTEDELLPTEEEFLVDTLSVASLE